MERINTGGMPANEDSITLDLVQLFRLLWKNLHLILITGALTALLAVIWTECLITPMYTASTSMYMLMKSEGSAGLTTGDLQTGSQLTQDYMEMVKSRSVLEEVMEVLQLNMTPEELEKRIEIKNKANTRILTISVQSEDPVLAKNIADALREASAVQIENIMDVDAVNTIEEANLPEEPSSPNVVKNAVLGGFAGAMLLIGFLIIRLLADDTVKTREHVEEYLELNVLTMIPIREEKYTPKKNKRRVKLKE